MPAPVIARHSRGEVEGVVGRRRAAAIVTKTVAPDCLDEGGAGGAWLTYS